jgi:hypothetical protein
MFFIAIGVVILSLLGPDTYLSDKREFDMSYCERTLATFVFLTAITAANFSSGHDPKVAPPNSIDSPEVAAEIVECAKRFLDGIDDDRKAKWLNVQLHFKDAERGNFHFFPIPRRGVALQELKEGQRQLAYSLLSSALSHSGNQKALTIMSLGDSLRESDENPNKFRDSDQYYFTIFGVPTPAGTWSYRVEGFHLSLNVTVVKGRYISVTPSFFGVIPAVVADGPRKGLEVLKLETQLGRALASSLTPEQRKTGFGEVPVFEETVGGLLTGNQRKIERGTPRGLSAEDMTAPQREILMMLVGEHINRIRSELAKQDLARIEKVGIKRIHFIWAGGLKPGEPHHYMIQGPTFLIEYDCTQDDANHVHCVYRDFDNDFGDALLQHYHNHHAGHKH